MGSIEVITGCMFSGKTEAMMARLNRYAIGRRDVRLVRPECDVRAASAAITGYAFHANAAVVGELAAVDLAHLSAGSAVGIDEAQFFAAADLVDFCVKMYSRGVHVIVCGLLATYDMRPFGAMAALLPYATRVEFMTAVCKACGRDCATVSRRNGPGRELVEIGGLSEYSPLCLACSLEQ